MQSSGDFGPLTAYEKKQVAKIKAWKKEEPGVVSKTFGVIVEPLAWLVRKVVPEAAIRGALDASNAAAKWLTDTEDIRKEAGCLHNIEELQEKDLAISDKLADAVHTWAIGMGTLEGVATGTIGLPGIAIDVPAIITLALRTIHKIGVCYGFEAVNEDDNRFVYGIMSASSANSVEEKLAALAALRSVQVTLAKTTWKRMTIIAAEKPLSKEGGILALKNLAKQLGVNLTKRKALVAIPFIGAAVGGSVNAWYIKELGWAARRAFQERWLIKNHKVTDV